MQSYIGLKMIRVVARVVLRDVAQRYYIVQVRIYAGNVLLNTIDVKVAFEELGEAIPIGTTLT